MLAAVGDAPQAEQDTSKAADATQRMRAGASCRHICIL